ncbi:MAG TPA: hypothetical protein VF765_38645 [Polyangiaceae bacterium]
MNVVTRIMRQHRHIHRLQCALAMAPDVDEDAMATLGEAVSIHAGTTEALLATLRDEAIERDASAHRIHHARARLFLFRLATCPITEVTRERSLLAGVLREHALHEAKVLQNLMRAFGEDRLEVLGTQMSLIDPQLVCVPTAVSRHGRCA